MILDDRDHRPDLGLIDNQLTDREAPARFRLVLLLVAGGLVALGYGFAALTDASVRQLVAAVLS